MAMNLPLSESLVSSNLSLLYEQDYYLWLVETAKRLQAGQLSDLDLANLVEEIEAMGRSEKRAVESNLEILLMHLLKYQYQSQKRTNSWKYTIREHRNRLEKSFKYSPSLKPFLEEVLPECYAKAIALAADETGLRRDTFPPHCPFTASEILDSEYLPN